MVPRQSPAWKFSANGHGGGTWDAEDSSGPSDGSVSRKVAGGFIWGHDTGFALGGATNSWSDPDSELSGNEFPAL